MEPLYLGLDVGGSSSRALLITASGEIAGQGAAGAGNPVMVAPAQAAREVGRAVTAALADLDPHRVRAAVLGIAGTSRFADPAVAAAFQQEWDRIGLTCPVQPVADVLVAFAAATPNTPPPRSTPSTPSNPSRDSVRVVPSDSLGGRNFHRSASGGGAECRAGTVLISGTGAVAASIHDGEMTAVADGLGWLLGDRGSGFWLGREAVIAVARALHAGRPAALLGELIMPAVLGIDAALDVDALVIGVHNDRPQRLAQLAPLVVTAADQGDPLALDIVARAAAELVATVAEIRRPGDCTPIVLAGSVLRHATVISAPVTSMLQTRWPAATVLISAPGEHGAAHLARLHHPVLR